MKNTKSFQERFNRWKNGESYWDIVGKPLREYKSEEQIINQEERDYLDSIVAQYERGKDSVIQNTISYNQWRESLPDNLKKETSNYDLYGAYKAGMKPRLEDDGYYHLGSRDPKTGRILKLPQHPTYLKALNEDAKLGYFPVKSKNRYTYTDTWKGNNPGYAKYDTGKPSNQQQVFRGDKTGQYFNENNEPLYVIDDNQSNNDPRTWTFGDYNGKVYNPIITNWDLEKERVAQQINDIEKNNNRRNNIVNAIGEITSNIPLVGDVRDALVATKDLYNKQYLQAGIGAWALLLPNIIEKPLKTFKNFYKDYKRKKYFNDIINTSKYNTTFVSGRQAFGKDYNDVNNFMANDVFQRWFNPNGFNHFKSKDKLTIDERNLLGEFGIPDGIKFYTYSNPKATELGFHRDGNVYINLGIPDYDKYTTLVHEIEHAQRHLMNERGIFVPSGYNLKEAIDLISSYPMTKNFIKDNGISNLREAGATNREIRAYISRENDYVYGDKLDNIISNMPNKEFELYVNASNLYGQHVVNNSPNYFKIKNTMKYVPTITLPALMYYGLQKPNDNTNN